MLYMCWAIANSAGCAEVAVHTTPARTAAAGRSSSPYDITLVQPRSQQQTTGHTQFLLQHPPWLCCCLHAGVAPPGRPCTACTTQMICKAGLQGCSTPCRTGRPCRNGLLLGLQLLHLPQQLSVQQSSSRSPAPKRRCVAADRACSIAAAQMPCTCVHQRTVEPGRTSPLNMSAQQMRSICRVLCAMHMHCCNYAGLPAPCMQVSVPHFRRQTSDTPADPLAAVPKQRPGQAIKAAQEAEAQQAWGQAPVPAGDLGGNNCTSSMIRVHEVQDSCGAAYRELQ